MGGAWMGRGRLAIYGAGPLETLISPTLDSPGGKGGEGRSALFFQSCVVLGPRHFRLTYGLTPKRKDAFTIAAWHLPRGIGPLGACSRA